MQNDIHISYQLLRVMNCNVFSRVLGKDGTNTIWHQYRVWYWCNLLIGYWTDGAASSHWSKFLFHSFRWAVNVFAGYLGTVSMSELSVQQDPSSWPTQNVLCSCLHVEDKYRYTLAINISIEISWIGTENCYISSFRCTSHDCFWKSLLSHSKSALPNPWCYPLST